MMKISYLIIFSFLFSIGLQAQAQTYNAPKLKLKSKDSPHAEVKPSHQDDWRSSYRVEDKALPQRELASEKKDWVDHSERETSRDPSSLPKPEVPNQNPNIRPWLWSGE